MAENWSEAEVREVVFDYFKMLQCEINGQKFNKTQHRHALMERLNNRSNGSIEMKHQNISAVLIDMGIPYINGYKPLRNYQQLLISTIVDFLKGNPSLQVVFEQDAELVPLPATDSGILQLEEPPKPREPGLNTVAEVPAAYNPTGVNYLEREASNQLLGDAGEEFVINYERTRLIEAGKESLADRIEQVSLTKGPAAGFDIRSFEVDGSDRFIEAKTTKYGKSTPFFITPNELRFSQENAQRYFLYRVFKFRETPRMFVLDGDVRKRCLLNPSAYLAKPM